MRPSFRSSVKNLVNRAVLPIPKNYDYDNDITLPHALPLATSNKIDTARATSDEVLMRKTYGITKKPAYNALAMLYSTIATTAQAIGKYIINDMTGYYDASAAYKDGEKQDGGGLGFFIKDHESYVERKFNMRGVSSDISLSDFDWEERVKIVTQTFNTFFQGAKLTRSWKRNEGEYLAQGSLQGKGSFTLNEIIPIVNRASPDIRKNTGGVTKVKAPTDFIKQWGKRVFFDMELTSNNIRPTDHPDVLTGELDHYSNLGFAVHITVRIQFPKEGAEWMTACDNPDDFSMLTFLRHIDPYERMAFIPKTKTMEITNQSSSPASTHRALQDFSKVVGKVPPRMNADGYTMLENGKVIYTNMVPTIEAFQRAEEAAYNEEAGQFRPELILGDKAVNFKNKMLIIDWQGNVMVYSNASGNIDVVGLQGSQAMKDADIGDHLLEDRITKESSAFEIDIYDICHRENITYEAASNLAHSEGQRDDVDISYTALDLHNEGDSVFTVNAKQKLLARGQMFKNLYEKFDTIPMALQKRFTLRYYVALFGYYATPQIAQQYVRANADNIVKYTGYVEPEKELTTTNLPGLINFYPHQKRIAGDAFVRHPENMMLGVAPGGGKCLHGDTVIPTSLGLLRVENLFNFARGEGHTRSLKMKVHAFGKEAYTSGAYTTEGKTCKLTFASGHRFEALPEHPLWVYKDGDDKPDFMRLGNMPNDGTIYLPRIKAETWPNTAYAFQTEEGLPSSMSHTLAVFLGLLLSEGNVTLSNHTVSFSNSCPELLDLYKSLVQGLFGLTVRPRVTSINGNVVTTSLDFSSTKIVNWFWRNDISCDRSGSLMVPNCIRMSTREHQAAFVSALWDGDGSFYQKTDKNRDPRWVSEYSSASKEIIEYMSAFLDNAGIEHRIYWKDEAHQKRKNVWGDSNAFAKLLVDYHNAEDFGRVLTLNHPDKNESLQKFIFFAKGNTHSFGVMDAVPGKHFVDIVRERVRDTSSFTGLTLEKLKKLTHTSRRVWDNSRELKKSRLDSILNALEALPSKVFTHLLEDVQFSYAYAKLRDIARYRFDRIIYKGQGAIERVYDLIVPGPQAYATNGIMSHNTPTYTAIAMDYKKNKIVKRPLIVMPAPLKRQYASELAYFSDHNIRLFPIYRQVWDRLQKLGVDLTQLQKIIEAQPENTIFLTDYAFLKMRPKTVRVAKKSVRVFTFAVWASRIFDMVIADESHKTKNLGSQTSLAFRTFSAYSKVKVQASGTIVYNSARDMIGQVNAFTPNIFGDSIQEYEQSKGEIAPALLDEFHTRLKKHVKVYTANKREWGFLLPKINQHIEAVDMNPLLAKFYQAALTGVMDGIREDMKKKKLDGDDPDKDAAITSLMQTALTPLEIFINAPDDETNGYAVDYKKLPAVRQNKELLKSPKIDKIDELITKHFQQTDSKVLVLSYNKAISAHTMRWSKHKNIMMHYTAEGTKDNDLVKEFIENPAYKVMVADENTLKEGFNLQIASLIIRQQTVWTVGEFDQSLARVERPDKVMEDGSLEYNRKSIDFEWIVISPSVEIAKTARLFSKIIEKTKVEEYQDNKRFQEWFTGRNVRGVEFKFQGMNIPMLMLEVGGATVTMSPEFVEKHNTFDSLEKRTAIYRLYSKWLDNEFAATKEELRNWVAKDAVRKQIAKEKGVKYFDVSDDELNKALSSGKYVLPEISDNRLRLGAMHKNLHDTIPGSEDSEIGHGYMPFLPGVTPRDPYNLGLIAASSVMILDTSSSDDDDDDDKEPNDNEDEETANTQENVHIETGMIVVTEFGIGECRRRGTSKTVYVDIPGRGGEMKPVGVPLTSVFIPKTQENRIRLRRIYESMRKKGVPTTTMTHDKGNIIIQDIYIPEKELFGNNTVKPNAPLIKAAPKQAPIDMDIDLPTRKPAAPTSVGAGLSPRSGRSAEPTPPTVVKPKLPPVTPVAPPRIGAIAGAPGMKVRTPVHTPVRANVNPPVPVKSATPTAQPKVRTPVKKKIPCEFILGHINNQLCIMAMLDDMESPILTDNSFHRLGTSVAAEVKSWRGLEQLLDYLHAHFTIDEKCDEALGAGLLIFKKNEHNFNKVLNSLAKSRDFLRNSTRVSKDPKVIFPYLVVSDDSVNILINASVSKAARVLKGKQVPGVRNVSRFEVIPPYYIKFCRNFADMHNTMEVLDDSFTISNLESFAKEYHKAKAGH